MSFTEFNEFHCILRVEYYLITEITSETALKALGQPTPLLQELKTPTNISNANNPATFLANFDFMFLPFTILKLFTITNSSKTLLLIYI